MEVAAELVEYALGGEFDVFHSSEVFAQAEGVDVGGTAPGYPYFYVMALPRLGIACGGEGVVGVEEGAGSAHHLLGHLARDDSVGFYHLVWHLEELLFHFVLIGYESAPKVAAGSALGGDGGGYASAGA